MSISHANLLWKTDELGNVVPTSTTFDDVYFSHSSGRDESFYVFCQGNHLAERFANIARANQPECFVIAETGFGTGLNFLVVAKLWYETMESYHATRPRLHFISTEKYPLAPQDLTTALNSWQDDTIFTKLCQALIHAYPLPLLGNHRRHFYYKNQQITLDLWLGDALDNFQQITASVNAWFLDGFAPSKNSELWSDEIFQKIKHLSAKDATLATFTAAGTVKRALQGIGMTVNKIKGFGRKREMITAQFDGKPTHNNPPKSALVIGAGVSGLCTAYALAVRGIQVTLLDKTAPLAGASGNPRAMFSPKLGNFDTAHDSFATHAFLYAQAAYKTWDTLGDGAIFEQTGVFDRLLPTTKTDKKLTNLVAPYPDTLIHTHTPSPFLAYLPNVGLVNPSLLAQFVLSHANINFVQANIKHLDHQNNLAIAHSDGQTWIAEFAVICLGFESHHLHPNIFKTRQIRGQVSWLNDKNLVQLLPHTAYKYDGYACCFDDTLLFGASFVRNTSDCTVLDDDHRFNLDKLTHALPQFQDKIDPTTLQGRASIRGQTPDYHPMVGQVSDGIFVCSAMGSKGFALAPLCGEILGAIITNEPLPIPTTMLTKLDPKRARLQTPLQDTD